MAHDLNSVFYSHVYHPIQAGSIDGTDTAPHDNAVYRAMLASSTGLYDPLGDSKAQGDPYCSVFVGRLSRDTTEKTLLEVMGKYGRIKNLRLVRHIVTGASQGYAFVEYETEKEMRYAYESAQHVNIDGSQVLVDYNRQLLMPGWIPRRLGGGLGGRKESGQLRFGGRDRPFRKPLRPIPEKELEKLGIPLPGNYLQRWEMPPLPKRKAHWSGDKSAVLEHARRSSQMTSKESQFRDDSGRRKQHESRADEDSKGYYYEDDYKRRHRSARRSSYQERGSDERSTYLEADHHKRYESSYYQERHARHERKSYASPEDHRWYHAEKHENESYSELIRYEKEDDRTRRYHAETPEEHDRHVGRGSYEESERYGKREVYGEHEEMEHDDGIKKHRREKREREDMQEEERETKRDRKRYSKDKEHHRHHRDRREDDDRYHGRNDEHHKEGKSSRKSPHRDGSSPHRDDNASQHKRRRADRADSEEKRKEKSHRGEMSRWDPSEV